MDFSRRVKTSWQYISQFWPILLPVLVLLPGIMAFPYPSSEAGYSDIVTSHFPNAIYLQKSILNWQVLPLWSPTILSGYPFAANPLSGIWYPPGWLAMLFRLPFGFNLSVLLHFLVGGWGMYKLLRTEGINHLAALFGGTAFVALPKLYAHYGAGHLSLMYALVWTPWLLYATNVSLKRCGGYVTGWKMFCSLPLQPVLFFVLICLADIRWTGYAIILWWGYALTLPVQGSGIPVQVSAKPQRSLYLSVLISRLFTLLRQTILALLIVAPFLISLWEYVELSTRSIMTMKDYFLYSLPIARLLGLFFPDFGGFHEWALYPGVTVLLLSFLAVLWTYNRQRTRFWTAVVLITLIYALGSNIPALHFLAKLPGLNLLRVPSRALFLTEMALIVLASLGLEHVWKDLINRERKRAVLVIFGIVIFMILITTIVGFYTSTLPPNFIWGSGFALFVGVGLILKMQGRLESKSWIYLFLILALIDWSGVNFRAYSPRATDEVLSEKKVVAEYMENEDGLFRIYSPSYSIPQQTSVLANLELVDGVDPLQIRAYAQFMEDASGIPASGYSVTIPPFENGDPNTANVGYLPDPYLLGILNTRFVVSEFDINVEGLNLVKRFDQSRIYENLYTRPRAWVQSDGDDLLADYSTAEVIVWQPNHIRLQAQGPGLLVLSEIDYPNWEVRVDENVRVMTTFMGLLRAVQLEDGKHEIVFSYWPKSLFLGLGFLGFGVIWVICILWLGSKWSVRTHAK